MKTILRSGSVLLSASVLVPIMYGMCVLSLQGCGGSPYGYARTYEPTPSEEGYLENADMHLSYEEVRRAPRGYRDARLAWFGVVEDIHAVPCVKGLSQQELTGCQAGKRLLEVFLSHRTHRQRHLCADATDASCRVTVSDRDGGKIVARMSVPPAELDGDERLWKGSLLRVYGSPDVPKDLPGPASLEIPDEDIPVIVNVEWYRHWPVGTYATTGDAVHMRR